MAGPEGSRPRFDRTPQQSTPTEQPKPHLKEGNGFPGIPATLNERSKPPPESQERQPLTSVWAYLERFTRLHAPDVEDRPRWGTQEYKREADELKRLERELREKGAGRDNLIHTLYTEITMEPTGTLPVPVDFRDLSLEEFQQFRAKVEPLSEEEIHKEIRKAKDEVRRKDEEINKRRGTLPPGIIRY